MRFYTSGIILKITQIKDDFFSIDFFSADYGRVKVSLFDKKMIKKLDIWYEINGEIYMKKKGNLELRWGKIKQDFSYIDRDYQDILEFLILIQILYKHLPFWVENREIYEIISYVLWYREISKSKIIFAQIKIFMLFWIFDEHTKDPLLQKIFSFIRNQKIQEILRLKVDDERLLSLLKQKINTTNQ